MRPFMVRNPARQQKIDSLIDMAYDYLQSMAAPKRPMPQHKMTTIDLNDVQAALVELSELTRGNIWGTEPKHIKSILEMLYAYGVDEAQQKLDVS